MMGLAIAIEDEEAGPSSLPRPNDMEIFHNDKFDPLNDLPESLLPIEEQDSGVEFSGSNLMGDVIYFKRRKKYDLKGRLGNYTRLATPFYQTLGNLEERGRTRDFEKGVGIIEGEYYDERLWVDKYRPSKFTDLLHVDKSNMEVLRWVNGWRNRLDKNRKEESISKKGKFDQSRNFDDFTEHGKIMLIAGPPGLGKTTLAHVVAKVGGFQIVEINASDERSGDSVLRKIESALTSDSMMPGQRPNLIIIDEIDGASAFGGDKSLISYLVKLSSFTAPQDPNEDEGDSKKKSTSTAAKRKRTELKRPIICICNDLYTSALKPLRLVAQIVTIKLPNAATLTKRLREICEMEKLKVDGKALLELADLMECDFRASLNALQFISRSPSLKNGQLTSQKLIQALSGFKDVGKSTLSLFEKIFCNNPRNSRQSNGGCDPLLSLIESHGEYERLLNGTLELYLQSKFFDDTQLTKVNIALDWFQWADTIQSFTLNDHMSSYQPFTLLKIHQSFSSPTFTGIKFPRVDYERYQEKQQFDQILHSYQSSVSSLISANPIDLVLDRVPYLTQIISPSFKATNPQLLKLDDRQRLQNIVSIMLKDGISYRQEKRSDSQPIDILGDVNSSMKESLSADKKPISSLDNAIRQMISVELEASRIQLSQLKKGANSENPTPKPSAEKNTFGRIAELQKAYADISSKKISKPLPDIPKIVKRDFFGRPITTISSNQTTQVPTPVGQQSKIWFKFNEGCTNAIRRSVRMREIMQKFYNKS